MPDRPVLYLGDTHLTGPASYLAALLTHFGYRFDYVPSDQCVDGAMIDTPRRLFILSDYPAAMMCLDTQQRLVGQVARGAGLVMIGGWESFRGQSGCWNGTPIAAALPVQIAAQDDRINCDQPALVIKRQDHPMTNGLPWQDRPPVIGGFNQTQPKPDGAVVLEVQRFMARLVDQTMIFEPGQCHPLLVTGTHCRGRTAALTTDLAPHWVGPLVDWGDRRLVARAPRGCQVEVGSWYATFVRQLLTWAGRLDNQQVSWPQATEPL